MLAARLHGSDIWVLIWIQRPLQFRRFFFFQVKNNLSYKENLLVILLVILLVVLLVVGGAKGMGADLQKVRKN